MDRLTAMQVFAEVAKRGGFTAAAEHLDISRVKATRYVSELESWLGTRLLQRSTRRVSLTEAGEACLRQCEQMLALTQDLQSTVGRRDSSPRGQLRMTTSISFGQAHLAGAVAEYLQQYPDVTVDLMVIDRAVNLIEDRVDLAIRTTGELDPNLVARRIAPCRSVICASPDYLKARGTPDHPQALREHNCLTYTNFGRSEWRFSNRQGEEIQVEIRGNLTANEASILMEAALAGAGVAQLPTYLANPLIERGELVELLPQWSPPELVIWGVYLSRRHLPATVRTMLDFLAERFRDAQCWEDSIHKNRI
ncbi:LysR-family transcriptional regulator clustered with [Marinobacterium lacunae]|uniref:LysR-family transcriptional regulator clustered with n=1 Tax=Marinobacterium lacunae TaxID=1232683 RepID=A0A081FZI8_9GAMM|nr:LysR family transcriptional regulator [Marinobacterium lacunae]KEA63943.1 LysR-family transcriptional regulator clustered with [Marinobacterium lacunae]